MAAETAGQASAGASGFGVDRVDGEDAPLAIHDRVDAPDQPVAVQDRQHVVAVLALGDGDVDLELEAEVEELERPVTVRYQRVERSEQRGPRPPGTAVQLGQRVGVGEPLPGELRRSPPEPPRHRPAATPPPRGGTAARSLQGAPQPVRSNPRARSWRSSSSTATTGSGISSPQVDVLPQVPDALRPLAAADGDLAAVPQDLQHAAQVLAVVPATGLPRHVGAIVQVAGQQRTAAAQLVQHVGAEPALSRSHSPT